ncbi:DUF4240 domain-containing protein [Micromonospora zamorensis]|uniref:DUF4240 domain-containing protein n=1 Tax=Micromonospora zamorensis TaxID=709883 RepID=UPI003D990F3F
MAVEDSRAVDVDEFWAVVESAGAGLDGRTGDDGEAIAAALVTRLGATSSERILEFQELFEQVAVGIDEAREPDMGEDFDFDNDDEMRRRLPRLAELFLRW